jgi:glutaredoxin
VKIEVVVSGIEGCPSCKRSVKLVKSVLKDFPEIQFGEINSLEEPERIQELGFISAGAVVINDKIEFSSTPKEQKLRDKIEILRK